MCCSKICENIIYQRQPSPKEYPFLCWVDHGPIGWGSWELQFQSLQNWAELTMNIMVGNDFPINLPIPQQHIVISE